MRTATKSSAREFALKVDQLTQRVAALEQSNNLLQQTADRVTAERDRALGELRLIKGSRSWKLTRLLRQMNALRRLPPRQIAHVVLRKASSILRRRGAQPQFIKKSCLIVTPPHTLHLANLYANELRAVGFRATVSDRLDDQFGHEHLFVFCANVFEDIRPGAVVIQMEQSTNSRWFDDSYFSKLAAADAIIDYSATNISFLRSHSEPFWKLFLIPVGASEPPGNAPSFQERDIDVLFYGDDNCPRRKRLLDALSKEFDIEIANDLYGENLWAKLRRAKIVLNIHYYENALLETTRISECLSIGTPVGRIGIEVAARAEKVVYRKCDVRAKYSDRVVLGYQVIKFERIAVGQLHTVGKAVNGYVRKRSIRRLIYLQSDVCFGVE